METQRTLTSRVRRRKSGKWRALVACGVAAACPTLAGAAFAQSSWNLTGAWVAASGNRLGLTQSGTTVTWVGQSGTNAWVHDFRGQISGDTITGTFQDRPGFSVHNYGSLTMRIDDDCHIVGIQISINGGPPSKGGELFTKTPCATDQEAPAVKVFPARGAHGKRITVRFRVEDNSGEADVVAAVWQGKRRISGRDYGFQKVDGRTLTITLTPSARLIGTLELWVVAADRAGNRSASHAPITVT